MTSFLPLVTAGGDMPAWMPWTLDHVQAGVLVLDAELRVVFANQWLLRRARLGAAEVDQRNLLDIFPEVHNSHLEKTLRQALRTGFSAVLSETLHLSPLPLFGLSGPRSDERRLKQSIQVVPMGGLATTQAGQRHVLVQVTDVTPAVARERLLKEQAGFDAVLNLFDSTISFHAQYQQSRTPQALTELLVSSPDNPRSLAWVAQTLRSRLRRIEHLADGATHALAALLPDSPLDPVQLWPLDSATPEALTALLVQYRQSARAVAQGLSGLFFTHSGTAAHSVSV